ncbi:hypothetical protein ANMWB30_23170 [Arthrobacter sp. MWB30]|nr:hypothetical protein ANMWB30_23170 [Arthrobacter sp. MWB30]
MDNTMTKWQGSAREEAIGAFDDGVRRGEGYMAVISWRDHDGKSPIYISEPYTTNDLVQATETSEGEWSIDEIYDLSRDRDYQIESPWVQWNTEAGPDEPYRAAEEAYREEYPETGGLSELHRRRLSSSRAVGAVTRQPAPIDPLVALGECQRALQEKGRVIGKPANFSQGHAAAFDEGVRRGAGYMAIVQWQGESEKSAVYISEPHRTEDFVKASEGEDWAVDAIYDLKRDRGYQLESPWIQWNTEAGPHELEREREERYRSTYPDLAPLSALHQRRLPEQVNMMRAAVIQAPSRDPLEALYASGAAIARKEKPSLSSGILAKDGSFGRGSKSLPLVSSPGGRQAGDREEQPGQGRATKKLGPAVASGTKFAAPAEALLPAAAALSKAAPEDDVTSSAAKGFAGGVAAGAARVADTQPASGFQAVMSPEHLAAVGSLNASSAEREAEDRFER